MYRIKVKYNNIDNLKEEENHLLTIWNKRDVAEKIIQYIHEHNEFFHQVKNLIGDERNKIISENKDKEWFDDKIHPMFYIKVNEDDGNKKLENVFWNGSFSKLKEACIVDY